MKYWRDRRRSGSGEVETPASSSPPPGPQSKDDRPQGLCCSAQPGPSPWTRDPVPAPGRGCGQAIGDEDEETEKENQAGPAEQPQGQAEGQRPAPARPGVLDPGAAGLSADRGSAAPARACPGGGHAAGRCPWAKWASSGPGPQVPEVAADADGDVHGKEACRGGDGLNRQIELLAEEIDAAIAHERCIRGPHLERPDRADSVLEIDNSQQAANRNRSFALAEKGPADRSRFSRLRRARFAPGSRRARHGRGSPPRRI